MFPSLYVKLIGGAVGAAALGIGIASWLARGAEIERLEDWQSSITLSVAQATGPGTKLKPSEVPAAIQAIKSSRDNAEAELVAIDAAAIKDKALQTKLDEQLAAILDSQDETAESTRSRITDLLNRKATGDREADCATMEADSNAAWNGWRN